VIGGVSTKPRLLPTALLALAAGCDVLGIGSRHCTLIGCTDGITVHLTALPAGPYRVEILVGSGPGGLSYAYDCAGSSACLQDIFFPELVLDRIIVRVTTGLGTRDTEIPDPVYVTSQPNGPECSPTCRQATVTAQLPGS
jgi:hypothetical protein